MYCRTRIANGMKYIYFWKILLLGCNWQHYQRYFNFKWLHSFSWMAMRGRDKRGGVPYSSSSQYSIITSSIFVMCQYLIERRRRPPFSNAKKIEKWMTRPDKVRYIRSQMFLVAKGHLFCSHSYIEKENLFSWTRHCFSKWGTCGLWVAWNEWAYCIAKKSLHWPFQELREKLLF